MKASYICENTTVRLIDGKEGMVIGVNPTLKIATIKVGRTFKTEPTRNLVVVSYKGV